jgi:hypothetical protein
MTLQNNFESSVFLRIFFQLENGIIGFHPINKEMTQTELTELISTVNSLRLIGVSYPPLENLLIKELKKALPNHN